MEIFARVSFYSCERESHFYSLMFTQRTNVLIQNQISSRKFPKLYSSEFIAHEEKNYYNSIGLIFFEDANISGM